MKIRYIRDNLLRDLETKIVLLGGPRQVGKTTLAQGLFSNHAYLNYDIVKDRPIILKGEWPKDVDLVVLDELHKLKSWKNLLKGEYDQHHARPRLIVTGSSRLDIVRKMGDSLAGRHFYWRLHPLSLRELADDIPPQQAMQRIIDLSGFPEPFYANDPTFYARWARTHADIILRQDLLDLERVSDIMAIETLLELLSLRVGQVTSTESLARDLRRSPDTIRRWIVLLENLFVIFRVSPLSRGIARALRKAPKYYFYDCARVQGDHGARFENLVACSLLKEIDLAIDAEGAKFELHYLRDTAGNELDFVITDRQRPLYVIEAKWSDNTIAPGFHAFSQRLAQFPELKSIQLVAQSAQARDSKHGTQLREAASWLAHFTLCAKH